MFVLATGRGGGRDSVSWSISACLDDVSRIRELTVALLVVVIVFLFLSLFSSVACL